MKVSGAKKGAKSYGSYAEPRQETLGVVVSNCYLANIVRLAHEHQGRGYTVEWIASNAGWQVTLTTMIYGQAVRCGCMT